MRLSAMGDVAMTVPVIASFLKAYPDVTVYMLSAPRFAPMFENLPNLVFIPVDTKRKYEGILGMVKLYRQLKRKYQFDVMLDLHDVIRSKALRFLFKKSGVPVYVIDKGRAEKKALIRQKNKCLVQLKTSLQRYMDVFEKAGFSFDISFNGLYSKDSELPEQVLKFLHKKQCKWLAIAPFAQHEGKIYPTRKMEDVVAYYSENKDIRILLFGGGYKETSLLESWEKRYPRTYSLAGKFRLSDELQILNRCDAVISMDSANMHLASLVKTPVISVWGATHPYAGFYGYGQDQDNIIQLDLPCRPCSIYGNIPCKEQNFPCMKGIDAQMIIDKVNAVLNMK